MGEITPKNRKKRGFPSYHILFSQIYKRPGRPRTNRYPIFFPGPKLMDMIQATTHNGKKKQRNHENLTEERLGGAPFVG